MSFKALRWAAEVLCESDMPMKHRLVLLALAHHHNAKTDACFPSVEAIAAFAGLGRRATQKALHELAERRIIYINSRRVRGRQSSNQYDLCFDVRGAHWDAPKGSLRGAQKYAPHKASRGARNASLGVHAGAHEPGREPLELAKGGKEARQESDIHGEESSLSDPCPFDEVVVPLTSRRRA